MWSAGMPDGGWLACCWPNLSGTSRNLPEPLGNLSASLSPTYRTLSDPIGSLSVTSGWVACDIVGLKWEDCGSSVGRLWEGRLA